ncbi:AraC family transcriptional regulator [Polymorphospora rubra]|uniref:AraC family transcriptional regulator n=1 Tax=Polymorphospora rubra TaxID=338584 RepID=A0A810N3U6_9ACTN|nr:AraC family transcriptional regulator [Polymorphospora rubra]BCJ68381.1 AraC family transcriptional regulator [Polymorphospora rubra]
MDALTGLLDQVRSTGALFGRNIMGSPWAIGFADGAPLTLVTMPRGDGWVVPTGAEPVRLATGDLAVVAGPAPFTVSGDRTPDIAPLYVLHGPNECRSADGGELAPDSIHLGVRTCGDRLDGPNVLLTGTYQVAGGLSGRLLAALPRVLVVPYDGRPRPLLELAESEIGRDDPGQQAVLDRLLDLLLIATLREWFARPGSSPPAWYRALSDPVVGAALRALHDDPARPWTVAALAREARVSRATFARRFTDLLGEPPMAYLTGWRLNLAADLLRRTDATVDSVARQVGYSTAYALSAAFKRHFGTRPTEHRATTAAA